MSSKIFYKFRPANDFTIALLEKQEMKFSFAEEYNDPFDSKLVIKFNNHIDIKNIIKRLEKTPIENTQKQYLKELIKSSVFTDNEYIKAAYLTAYHTVMSSCFAGNPESLLLWSHYADSHKGICIGLRDCSSTGIAAIKFNVKGYYTDSDDLLSDGHFPVYKVNYSDTGIVEYNLFEDDIQIFIDAHRNKAECWKYEDEYRLILPRGAFNSQILRFDSRFLAEVYLGCCIDKTFRSKVLQILKARYLDIDIEVKVFQMVRSKERFVLEKEELKI